MPASKSIRVGQFLLLLVLLLLVVCLEWYRQSDLPGLSTTQRATSYLVWIALTTVAWSATCFVKPVIGWAIAGAVAGGFWAYHVGSWIDAFQTFIEGELWPAALYVSGPCLGTIVGSGFGAMLSRDKSPATTPGAKSEAFAGNLAALMSAVLLFCTTILVLLLSVLDNRSQTLMAKAVGIQEERPTRESTLTTDGMLPENDPTEASEAATLEMPSSDQIAATSVSVMFASTSNPIADESSRVALSLGANGLVTIVESGHTLDLKTPADEENLEPIKSAIESRPQILVRVDPGVSFESLALLLKSLQQFELTSITVQPVEATTDAESAPET